MSKRIKEIIVRYDDKQSFIYGNTLGEVIGELVRCKECKHWEMRNSPRGWCVVHQGYVSPQYFCADGERREP